MFDALLRMQLGPIVERLAEMESQLEDLYRRAARSRRPLGHPHALALGPQSGGLGSEKQLKKKTENICAIPVHQAGIFVGSRA